MDLTTGLLSIVIALCSLILYFVHRRLNYWKSLGVPHDQPHFLQGNLKDVGKKYHEQDIYRSYYNKYKGKAPFVGFYFFQTPMAFVTDLELAKKILIKDFNNFADRPTYYNEKDDPLTAHLFNLETAEWRKLRGKLSPTFTSGKMKQMCPMVVQVGEECSRVFSESLKQKEDVDLRELFSRFTTDVIGTCIFGLECNSLKDPEAEFRVMNKLMFTESRHSALVHALIFCFPKMARRLGMREMHDKTHEFYFRIVRETVEYREKNNIKRNDFMNMLIEMKNSKNEESRLSLQKITANAFLFFVAGFETSSTTMTWALYELAKNPEIRSYARIFTEHWLSIRESLVMSA